MRAFLGLRKCSCQIVFADSDSDSTHGLTFDFEIRGEIAKKFVLIVG